MSDTYEKQRAEEKEAIAHERKAFERRHAAFIKVTRQFYPHGTGQPAEDDLHEWEAADVEWKSANAEIERISEEIRTGKRK